MKTLEKPSDYELIDLFLSRKEPESRNAFRILHDRYLTYMMIVAQERTVTSFRRQWQEAAEDIVQDALEKVFIGLPKFKKTANLEPSKQEKHFKTWLYRIVENAFIDYHRKYYHEMDDVDEVQGIARFASYEEGTEMQVRSLPKASKERHQQIVRAVESLAPKEVEILRAYVRYGKIDDDGNWVLDPEVLSNLSKNHNVKPNSIQQSKKRIIDKIKELIDR